ncbi:uncharacterized protein [Hetaerina americana]|uniref:uncharacterized protein n=1 Tax=Hetaerina americana TaxID=62018 RepID=UPI003A7F40F4
MSEADVLKDLLKGFQKIGESAGLSEGENNAASGLLDQLINGYGELNKEEKAKFLQSAQEQVIGHFQGAITSHMTQAYYMKFGIVAFSVIVILFLFVFFGYKLIKSIKDKEKKKEEKKKQKQSKKKK